MKQDKHLRYNFIFSKFVTRLHSTKPSTQKRKLLHVSSAYKSMMGWFYTTFKRVKHEVGQICQFKHWKRSNLLFHFCNEKLFCFALQPAHEALYSNIYEYDHTKHWEAIIKIKMYAIRENNFFYSKMVLFFSYYLVKKNNLNIHSRQVTHSRGRRVSFKNFSFSQMSFGHLYNGPPSSKKKKLQKKCDDFFF